MMLRSLYDLAIREGLLEDPDFERKRVDYILRIADDGSIRALVPTADESGRAAERMVPRVPKRTVKITPSFLFDNARYVLGLTADEEDVDRAEECASAFAALVDACATSTSDAGALAVARFLARRPRELQAILAQRPREEWTGSEWIAFALDDDGPMLVHERSSVRAYWADCRRQSSASARSVRCLVTGQTGPLATLHGSIKGVPGAQTSGAALVSFNDEAFTSHGLDQGENAPVARAAAEGYVTALNWLLAPGLGRRHRQAVRVGDESIMVFWTRDPSPAVDVLAALLEPTAEDAMRLAEAPWSGLEPADADVSPFYAATLSGNAARVVVRDWIETTVAEVKRHVRDYFADLAIGHDAGAPMPVWLLMKALVDRSGRGLSPQTAGRVLHAAFSGGPLPREVLSAALRRLSLPPDKNDERRLLRLRVALIKVTLLRLPRGGRAPLEVTVSLDENQLAVPYVLGRLFAVLERLQGQALGDVNATVRDRYFGAAAATPALVFPRLLKLSVHHAAKAEGAGWLEKEKGRIIGFLPAAPFPRTLTLEDQGLFAVGYYHQRERFFEKRPAAAPAAELVA